jgi:hypothetical protein
MGSSIAVHFGSPAPVPSYLGTPGSSPAPEATLERGGPRDNPGELAVDL